MSEHQAPHATQDETDGGSLPPSAFPAGRVMKTSILLLGLLLAACSSGKPSADADSAGHGDMQHAAAATSTPAAKAFEAAADKMHKDMAVVLPGDAETHFRPSVIPAHSGRGAMAKVALEHGKDPEVREIAKSVIAAQEKEITVMRSWLARRDKAAPQSPPKVN